MSESTRNMPDEGDKVDEDAPKPGEKDTETVAGQPLKAPASKDGEHVLSWPSNISSTPVEVAERNSPLFFHYKRMRAGSGGKGKFRGGLGQDMLIESESPRPIVMSFMAERTRFPAPGLAGGGAGGLGDVRINGKKVDHRRQHVLVGRVLRARRVRMRHPHRGQAQDPGKHVVGQRAAKVGQQRRTLSGRLLD